MKGTSETKNKDEHMVNIQEELMNKINKQRLDVKQMGKEKDSENDVKDVAKKMMKDNKKI